MAEAIKNNVNNTNIKNKEEEIKFEDIKEFILDGKPYDIKNKPVKLSDVILLDDNAYIKDKIKEFMNELASQKELVEYGLVPSRTVFLSGNPGLGKALCLDSKILTPTGWKLMRDIKIGDIVFDSEGNKTKVLGVYPQGKRQTYKIYFNDRTSIIVDEEHLNPFYQWKRIKSKNQIIDNKKKKVYTWGKKEQVLETKDLIKYLKECKKKHDKPLRIETPCINFDKQNLDLDPYILGLLLGDGCLTDKWNLSFANLDIDIIYKLDKYCKSVGDTLKLCYNKKKNKEKQCQYRISGNNIKNKIIKLNLLNTYSNTKFIPKEYLFNSIENRIALLQGLMDTDGCCWNGKTIKKTGTYESCYFEYLTVSKQLSEDFAFLVRSLGAVDTISKKKCFYYDKDGNKKICKDGYRHYIKFPNNIIPFRCERKILNIREKEFNPLRKIVGIKKYKKLECQCIYVDSPKHTYIANDFIPTHNTYLAKAVATRLNYPLYIVDVAGVLKENGMESIRKVFKFVTNPKNQPCILFLDECDGIALSRENKAISNANKAESNRITNFIMQVLQEENDSFTSRLVIFAATNYMDAIDEAFLNRFQVQMYFYLPQDYIPFIELEVKKNSMFELQYDVDDEFIKTINTFANKSKYSIRALNSRINQVFKQEIITRKKENRLTGDVIPIKLSSILQGIANDIKLGLNILEIQDEERNQDQEFNQIMKDTENL